MPIYPYSRLFIGPSRTVSIAGPHIQILDTITGVPRYSTTTSSENDAVLKSGPVRCSAVDKVFNFLLTAGEDKILKLWNLDDLSLISQRELPKKPTSVAFSEDGQFLLVSDKFGDVFSYPFVYIPLPVNQEKDALASHENPSGGQLILGHASPLNTFLLTTEEKYIITADRDEHIRVSRYPKGYNIERYCLGHLKFVSAIHIPACDTSALISGGGDPMLKVWDWMTGVLKCEIHVQAIVEPFVVIKAVKRKSGEGENDDLEEAADVPKVKRRKRKGGKGKQKEREMPLEDEEMGRSSPGEEHQEKKVLVIHRIESLKSESGTYIVFSVVGSTALFVFPYQKDESTIEIKSCDLSRPILDFSVVDGTTVVVCMDGAIDEGDMVKVLTISEGALIENKEELRPLVESLNTTTLISATQEDIQRLDLYGDLISLPKYALDGDASFAENTEVPIGAPELSSVAGRGEPSKKELGRMKTKQAVLEAKQANLK